MKARLAAWLRAFLRDKFGPQCVNPYCAERGNHDRHRK